MDIKYTGMTLDERKRIADAFAKYKKNLHAEAMASWLALNRHERRKKIAIARRLAGRRHTSSSSSSSLLNKNNNGSPHAAANHIFSFEKNSEDKEQK